MPEKDTADRLNALAPDDARVFEIFKDIESQYADYLRVNNAADADGYTWSDLPVQPTEPDVPLSLTVWVEPKR